MFFYCCFDEMSPKFKKNILYKLSAFRIFFRNFTYFPGKEICGNAQCFRVRRVSTKLPYQEIRWKYIILRNHFPEFSQRPISSTNISSLSVLFAYLSFLKQWDRLYSKCYGLAYGIARRVLDIMPNIYSKSLTQESNMWCVARFGSICTI